MPTLLVLLREPVAGRVKTRLAAGLGAERAALLYREWIGVVLSKLQPLRGTVRIVAYFDGPAVSHFAAWQELADEWWPQPDGNLGERLDAGFATAQVDGQPVIAIGSDCLEIDAGLISEALTRLATHDAVFGPAPDGGYYLVGTSRHSPGFFDSVPWSSHETLAAHLALCHRRGMKVTLLPPRRDIDTLDDWLEQSGKRETAT